MNNNEKSELRYFDIPILDINEIENLLKSESIRDVCSGILSACSYYEYDFGIYVCKQNFNRKEKWIRKNILNGLLLIISRFDKIDINFAQELIDLYSKENDLEIKYGVNDLLEEIEYLNNS